MGGNYSDGGGETLPLRATAAAAAAATKRDCAGQSHAA